MIAPYPRTSIEADPFVNSSGVRDTSAVLLQPRVGQIPPPAWAHAARLPKRAGARITASSLSCCDICTTWAARSVLSWDSGGGDDG